MGELTKAQRDCEADAMLTRMTDDHIARALERGKEQLRALDVLERAEDLCPSGPFPLSKSYESWSGKDYAYRRQQLNVAITDVEAERARRAVLEQKP